MSPEINGNPPSAAKRKKNRDKKPQKDNSDLNMSNYFCRNSNSYNNLNLPMYSCSNYSNGTEPMSLPIYPTNYQATQNLGFHYMGPSSHIFANPPMLHSYLNGDKSTDYLSLPVVDQADGSDASKRRFSDPGAPNDSDSSLSSLDGKVLQTLTHQVNTLKDSNKRLSKEIMELRMEVKMLKQQHNSRHLEREYEPGMLADVIREVRDAARVREDALLARVKYIIEEKQLNMNHMHFVAEKNRNNDRIGKLEEQLKNLTVISKNDEVPSTPIAIEDGNSARQVIELEREALELRRELQDTRAKKEEADQKILLLDKKLTQVLRRNPESITSDISDNARTDSGDSASISTTVSSISHGTPRVTLSGPVTDL